MLSIAVLGALLLLAAVLAVTFVGISSRPRAAPPPPATATARQGTGAHVAAGHATGHAAAAPTVLATVASWQLQAPIESEVALPVAGGGGVELFGGTTTGNRAAEGIFTLDTATGALVHVANLGQPLSDATGADLGGENVVFGGDLAAPLSTVQGLAAGPAAAPAGSSVPVAAVVGALPGPRAGATAVTAGAVTYVVGGTAGATPAATILATRDGRVFTAAATLPVPVTFPAVAALGGRLYVFGGESLTGSSAGKPVATIQVVDLATHAVTMAGRLPTPLAGAAAVTLGGHVFVVGGDEAPGVTSGTVWGFNAKNLAVTAAGQLRVPVAHAGVVVLGPEAWIVGGESRGAPTAAVQSLTS